MVESNDDLKSHSFKKYKSYDLKKGIVFGAMGGFVASIAFTGFILFLSLLFNYPEGAFLDALGISIVGLSNDIVSIGLAALAIILAQGIIIGIIFGIIVSKIKILNPSNKKKGCNTWVGNRFNFIYNFIFSNGVHFNNISKSFF